VKNILILAYDFPPYVSVGGMRPYNWYRYFKEFGVNPVVITRQWSNHFGNQLDYIAPSDSNDLIIEETQYGSIYRTPYRPNLSNRLLLKYGEKKFKIFRKLISGYFEFTQYVFNVGPKKEIYYCAKEYLRKNKVDAIIATGDPFVLFSYASQLSDEFNIPWIADYRDCWVQDKTRSGNFLLKQWNAFFERKYIRNVFKITTVSSFIQKQLEQNITNKPFEIIHNGFDPEVKTKASKILQQNNKMTIAFAGTIYKWHPMEDFLNVCNELINSSEIKHFQLELYGINIPTEIGSIIDKRFPNLKSSVFIFPKLDNETLSNKLAQANAFLLFNDYSILGTKIFTYLGLKRKIILCFSEDTDAIDLKKKYYNLQEFDSESKMLQQEVIESTNSGVVVKNKAHLKQVLTDLNTELFETGKIECNSHGIENYSRKIQVEKLAGIIKSIDLINE